MNTMTRLSLGPALAMFLLLGIAACSNDSEAPQLPAVPESPSLMQTSRLSDASIQISWTDNASDEDGFRIWREPYGQPQAATKLGEVAANVTTYTDASAAAATTYTYHVRAFNAGGESRLYAGMAGSTLPSFIATYAGAGEAAMGEDGVGPFEAKFYWPKDLTFGPDDGIPYILDWNNHRVRVLDKGGLRTIIGTGELGDGSPGGDPIPSPPWNAKEIKLNHPTHISFDPQGRLILSAWHNSKIMRMDLATGKIDNFCGDGRRTYAGDGGLAAGASVNLPSSTAWDNQGRMYISDQENQRVRRIELDGTITTVVGTGIAGFAGDGGPATQAQIYAQGGQAAEPQSRLAIGPDNNLYIADSANQRVRMVDQNGIITTVAGRGGAGEFDGDGGPATAAHLFWPADIAFSPEGELYIADTWNDCIRKVDQSGIITTVAGQGKGRGYGGDGGPPTAAMLNRPAGITFDAHGNLYIADTQNHRIRVVHR
jgi:hypothetical protein